MTQSHFKRNLSKTSIRFWKFQIELSKSNGTALNGSFIKIIERIFYSKFVLESRFCEAVFFT